MKTVIKSLALNDESVSFINDDNKLLIVELKYKDHTTLKHEFPTSMLDAAEDFYSAMCADVVGGSECLYPINSKMVH